MRNGKKEELSFTVLASQGDWHRNVLGTYIAKWKKYGIRAKLKQLDWTAMNQLVDEHKFDAFLSGFRGDYPIRPRQTFHSSNTKKGGYNSYYFVNEEADALIDKVESELDREKRIAYAQDLHRLIYHSHINLFHHEAGGCLIGKLNGLRGVEVAPYDMRCTYWPRWYRARKDVATR